MVGDADQARSLIEQNKKLQENDKVKSKQISDLKHTTDTLTKQVAESMKSMSEINTSLQTLKVTHKTEISIKSDEITKLQARLASKENKENSKKSEELKKLEEVKAT